MTQPDYAALYAYYARGGGDAKRRVAPKKKKRVAKKKGAAKRVIVRRRRPESEPEARPVVRRRRAVEEKTIRGRRGWSVAKVALNLQSGEPYEAKAQVLEPNRFFAVHANVDQRGLYDLTHIPSGARVNSASTGARGLAKLKKLAQKLEQVADWGDPRIVRDHRRRLESQTETPFMRQLGSKVAGLREGLLGR